jgi:hypothetical protein
MDRKTQGIIDKCHKLLKRGYSLDQCLERFSSFDREIRDYFSIAEDLKKLKKLSPSKEFTKNSLESIISRAGSRDASEKIAPAALSPGRLILRPAMIFMAFIVISVFSFAGTLFASQESMPGETLYPLKRSFEQFQLNIYPESMKGGLHLRFLGNRINEAEILLAAENGIDPSLIEGLIAEIDRQYRSCSQYDCMDAVHEDDILDSIDSIKNRYRSRYGKKAVPDSSTGQDNMGRNGKEDDSLKGGSTGQDKGNGGQGSGKGGSN